MPPQVSPGAPHSTLPLRAVWQTGTGNIMSLGLPAFLHLPASLDAKDRRQLEADRLSGTMAAAVALCLGLRAAGSLLGWEMVQLLMWMAPGRDAQKEQQQPLPAENTVELGPANATPHRCCAVVVGMAVLPTLWPHGYVQHRTLILTAVRINLMAYPVATSLRLFNATVSAPSSLPGLGWAIDCFLALFGGFWPRLPAVGEVRPLWVQVTAACVLEWAYFCCLDPEHSALPCLFPPCCAATRNLVLLRASGARLPLRLHIPLQVASVAVLALRGGCFCESLVRAQQTPGLCLPASCMPAYPSP